MELKNISNTASFVSKLTEMLCKNTKIQTRSSAVAMTADRTTYDVRYKCGPLSGRNTTVITPTPTMCVTIHSVTDRRTDTAR